MYAQAVIKPKTILRNDAHGNRYEGCAYFAHGCSSLCEYGISVRYVVSFIERQQMKLLHD